MSAINTPAAPSPAVAAPAATNGAAMIKHTDTGETIRNSRAHSQPMPAPISMTQADKIGAPSHTTPRASGIITSEERMRSPSPPR